MPGLSGHFGRTAGAFAAAAFLLAALAACGQPSQGNSTGPTTGPVTRIGNPDRGSGLIDKLGCGSCHVIPGIENADGMVGPPLDHIGSRNYVAGMLRNTPDNMVTWLRHPQQVVPGNAMPDLGISEIDGRDIAAYLETLK